MTPARRLPILPAIVSLSGLAFCLWVYLSGGKELCLTNGCALFQDFSLAGVSLWLAGSVLFATLLLLCVLRLPHAALFIAGAALAADILLMAVMAVTAPCMNCLIAGLAIALTFAALLRYCDTSAKHSRSPLLLTWGLFFIIASGGILRDVTELWSPLPRNNQTSVQVFFSPSCRACQTLTEQASSMPDAAWFPVAEDSRDIWLIYAMARHLEGGLPLPEAIKKAHGELPRLAETPDLMDIPGYRTGLLRPDMLLLQFHLWRNRAHVLSAGSDRLPFVEFRGLPSFLVREPAHPMPENAPSSGVTHEIPGVTDFGVAGFCGEKEEEKDCEEPRRPSPPSPKVTGSIDTSEMLQ